MRGISCLSDPKEDFGPDTQGWSNSNTFLVSGLVWLCDRVVGIALEWKQ